MIDRRYDTWLGRYGFTHDLIEVNGVRYLERWILWCGFGTLRLHRFLAGDDASRGPHDHQWWFITIPFRSYVEFVPDEDGELDLRTVSAWRPHFRSSCYRHLVEPFLTGQFEPFYTIVITGPRARRWGFWQGSEFIPVGSKFDV